MAEGWALWEANGPALGRVFGDLQGGGEAPDEARHSLDLFIQAAAGRVWIYSHSPPSNASRTTLPDGRGSDMFNT
jgi:hypothetical protein